MFEGIDFGYRKWISVLCQWVATKGREDLTFERSDFRATPSAAIFTDLLGLLDLR